MKPNKIDFDELDLKCLSELSTVLDVLSSTGNKIGRIFNPLIIDCNNTIKANLPKNWSIEPNKSYNLQYFPLTNEYDKKVSIEILENEMRIESAFLIHKVINKKETNFLWIFFGYYFSSTEDETTNHYYFSTLKGNVTDRFEGKINSNEFYKAIDAKNKSFDLDITHPERGDKSEGIDVIVKEHKVDKILSAYDFFKNEVLIPTLKNIKANK
jgi:hypothetical protein